MKKAFPVLAILVVAAVFVALFLLFNTGCCAQRRTEEFWTIGSPEEFVLEPGRGPLFRIEVKHPRTYFFTGKSVYFRIIDKDGPLVKEMVFHKGVYTGFVVIGPSIGFVEFDLLPKGGFWNTATYLYPGTLLVSGGTKNCQIVIELTEEPGRKMPLFKLAPGAPIRIISGRHWEDCRSFVSPASD